MEIYSAEACVKKLLNYVQDLAQKKPNMYAKSKERLRGLALTCEQVVSVISDILEEEILSRDIDEFDNSSNTDLVSMFKSIRSDVDKLEKFVTFDTNPESNSNTSVLSTNTRRAILTKYGNTLRTLSEKYIEYVPVSDCAKLLWNWFDTRFFKTAKTSPNFKYNIRRIPRWICCIVILYSKHLSEGTQDIFVSDFNSWCESLNYSQSNSKFAVPYEVYQLDKSLNPDLLTLTAVVMWDILLDSGLSKMCTDDENDLYLQDTFIYDLCVKHKPNILDDYVNYHTSMEILHECKITRNGGTDK